MINTSRLLVVVDGSPAGQRAVEYVGALIGRRKGFRLCLAHLLPPLPAELLEFGGAENPTEETREQAQLLPASSQYPAFGLCGSLIARTVLRRLAKSGILVVLLQAAI